jgi:hypothetical protein
MINMALRAYGPEQRPGAGQSFSQGAATMQTRPYYVAYRPCPYNQPQTTTCHNWMAPGRSPLA